LAAWSRQVGLAEAALPRFPRRVRPPDFPGGPPKIAARYRTLQSDSRSASPLGSPTDVFAIRRINASRHAACFTRSGPVARNGLSLTRNSCSLSEPPFRGQSSWPATSLPYRPFSLPVRIFGSTPLLVCARKRWLHRLNPVAAPPCGSPGCSYGLHSPPGLLHPSGSKRSTASATSRSAFRIRPISSRSPQPVPIK
jgi:hypothetical protein